MGNHEYCIHCGESDFHYHRPCNPKKVAKLKELEAAANSKRSIEVSRMRAVLDRLGVSYTIDEYGTASIRHTEFSDSEIKWRKERQSVKIPCDKSWKVEVGWDDCIENFCVREKGHDGECRA
jgi:hypothetical protein